MSSDLHEALDNWFVQEVLPLEPMLIGFLRHHCRETDDIVDLRQDVYVRVYEAAEVGLPANTKAFVFAVARNLLIDRARHRQVAAVVALAPSGELPDAVDELCPERHAMGRQAVERLEEAFSDLPPKCREVVELRKIAGLSQRDVAAQLGITEGTVEKQIAKGIRFLAAALGACRNKVKTISEPEVA
ncbi:RNA polymerase sigma factor [Massilia pinisoli]|uniref:RNA polymerase sigma factor n=1 Tax=Massilia pinisoli TaxID=1772194 RepID=A0ABT1ZQN3_9BURK|nr:RNA polymerase sigma factor [Massilia pinisoli]MCS0582232.1 RNA polymerase sigma factor [Massilia pinisoli]